MPVNNATDPPRPTHAQIVWWRTVETMDPLRQERKDLRISVLYASGRERIVPARFRNREHLSKYVVRYYPGIPELV